MTRRRPVLLAVSGPPGSGKTTLARAVAETLGWPLVCRDEIKERMAAQPGTDHDGNIDQAVLETFFRSAAGHLERGTSLAAEAAFQDRLWRPGLEALAGVAAVRVVRCAVDPALARDRIADRAARMPERAVHHDADLLDRIERGERPLESWVPITLDVPCLTVNTTCGWHPDLSAIAGFAVRQ